MAERDILGNPFGRPIHGIEAIRQNAAHTIRSIVMEEWFALEQKPLLQLYDLTSSESTSFSGIMVARHASLDTTRKRDAIVTSGGLATAIRHELWTEETQAYIRPSELDDPEAWLLHGEQAATAIRFLQAKELGTTTAA